MPASAESIIASRVRPGEGRTLGGALYLDQGAHIGGDDVHVHLRPGVLLVRQVEPDPTADHPDRDRGDLAGQRLRVGQLSPFPQVGDRIGQRDVGPGDRRRPGTAVGLQHVAVDRDGVLTQRTQVDAGTQRAADQPGDLVRPAADPALDRFPVAAFVGRRRQHRVLGGQPAEAGTLAPARHPGGDRGRAQHLGPAELDQHRTRRVLLETAGESHRPKFVIGPAVSSVHVQKASGSPPPDRARQTGHAHARTPS